MSDSQKLARRKIDNPEDDNAIINLMIKRQDSWSVANTLTASALSTWLQQNGHNWDLFDREGRQLTEQTCLEDVIQDRTYEIYLVGRNAFPGSQTSPRLNNEYIIPLVRSHLYVGYHLLNIRQENRRTEAEYSLEVQTKDNLSISSDGSPIDPDL